MNLKVLKHKNYGWMMSSTEKSKKNQIRFYWSVYKLNNGNIIVQLIDEYIKNNRVENYFYNYSYANCKLKNDELIIYDFKLNFRTFFESAHAARNIKDLSFPSIDEEKCVYNFYYRKYMQSI